MLKKFVRFNTSTDGGYEGEDIFRDFSETYSDNPVKDLETAKNICADGCNANKDCKYADLFWMVDIDHKYCSFWTKECEMVDNEYMDTYVYTKPWDEIHERPV